MQSHTLNLLGEPAKSVGHSPTTVVYERRRHLFIAGLGEQAVVGDEIAADGA